MGSTGYSSRSYDGPNSYDDPYVNQATFHHPRFIDEFMDGPNETFGEQRAPPLTSDPTFDILEWHPAYQSCQRYFLDHAQHEPGTQALCSLVNIRLPFQWLDHPITSSISPHGPAAASDNSNYSFNPFQSRSGSNNHHSPSQSLNGSRQTGQTTPVFVSLVPYIRRLVITGFDKQPILHGFFGDEYVRGVLPHLDCERRNYLFAAKHGGWRSCKKQYDIGSGGGGDESVPFMKPLDAVKMEELTAAEKAWSGWLAMEDWMVGPRAPEDQNTSTGQTSQRGGAVGMHDRHHRDELAERLPDGVGEAFRRHA